jgi:cobalt-zinc-cadmium efflux system membrane fusion protein
VYTRWAWLFALLLLPAGCKEKPADAEVKKAAKKDFDVELSDSALQAAHLTTGKPRVSPKHSVVTAAGTIEFVPSRVARIGPQIAGRVADVKVAPGQTVQKGAVVTTIDSVDVGRAQADLLSAQSHLKQSEMEVAREERLVAGGASSERALAMAQTERTLSQTSVKAAEDRLRTLGARASGGASTLPLTSPLAGKVLEVKARIGQPVGPTDTLVVVGEIDEVWLGVDIYERDVAKVGLGNTVRVTAVAFPDQVFEGKVDQLATALDPERRVLEARIVLPNPKGSLRPGMTATARILGAESQDAGTVLTVPRGAAQAIDGLSYVFVEKEKGKYWMRPVERGADIEDSVEILRGLNGDETIVVDGTFILKSEVLRESMGAND